MSKKIDLLTDGPKRQPKAILVLAHGAGAPMDSDFMNTFALLLAKEKIKVIRFEFPYMAERRESGKRKPPNTASILEATWLKVVDQVNSPRNIFIGGKSMGQNRQYGC